jgi:LysR family transcriptional activator of nhaA
VLIKSEKLGLFGTKKFQSLARNFPQSLHQQRVILPTAHAKLRSELEHFFRLNKVHPQVIYETQDTMVQKLMASKGEGLVFLPLSAIDKSLNYKLEKVADVASIRYDYFLVEVENKRTSLKEQLVQKLKGRGNV